MVCELAPGTETRGFPFGRPREEGLFQFSSFATDFPLLDCELSVVVRAYSVGVERGIERKSFSERRHSIARGSHGW
jgi:hypothetical protein